MSFLKSMIRWQTFSGLTFNAGHFRVTPLSRVLTIRFPYGAIVWNQPLAVLVERNGQEERIPIVDVTRIAIVALLGVGLGLSVASLVLSAQQKGKQNG